MGPDENLAIQVATLITVVERLEKEVKGCIDRLQKTVDDQENQIRTMQRDSPWIENCQRHAAILEKLEAKLDAYDKRLGKVEAYQNKQKGIREFLPWVIGVVGGLSAIIMWIKTL